MKKAILHIITQQEGQQPKGWFAERVEFFDGFILLKDEGSEGQEIALRDVVSITAELE